MVNRLSRFSVLLLGGPVALACFLSAQAETDIEGRWRFETEIIADKGCAISGEIHFTPTPKPEIFSCTFVAREDCGTAEEPRFQIVRQTCTARVNDKQVRITSQVEEVVDAGPPSMRPVLMDPQTYRADDFDLSPVSDQEMIGAFHSINRAGVRFWRQEELLS